MKKLNRAETRFYSRLGAAIRMRRQDIGMSQADLGAALRLTRTSVCNIEAGRQRILVSTLVEIGEALETPAHRMLHEAML